MLPAPLEESASTALGIRARKRVGIGLAVALVSAGVASCGGERQDANEPEGNFPVQVVNAGYVSATSYQGRLLYERWADAIGAQWVVAAFGHNDHPVNYRPNRHNYKIKVRSERRRVEKRSDWSPPLAL